MMLDYRQARWSCQLFVSSLALVKAERKHAAALENVAEFLKKRKEQSDALFTQAKEEMEEARNKLAEAEQARRLLLSKTVVNTKFPS